MKQPGFKESVLERIRMHNESAVPILKVWSQDDSVDGDDGYEVVYSICSPDEAEERHFFRFHRVQNELDPFWSPDLGPCWFAYDNVDTGIYFESRKFAEFCVLQWVDDALEYEEQQAAA